MGYPSRRTRLAACAVAAGALLSALVPAAGAAAGTAVPAGPRPVAADDLLPGHEGMPDDGFADVPEGEQDDLAGTGSSPSARDGADARAVLPGRPGDFTLAAGPSLTGLVGELEAALPQQGLTALMEQANRDAAWNDACGVAGIYGPDLRAAPRVCWEDDDATSSEWIPQAITGVSDAQEDEDWGTSTAEPIAVAGYDAENPGRSDYASGRDDCVQDSASDACNEKGVRVSFFDQATQKYRHVLLVWPYTDSEDHISFDALHARAGQCTAASGVTASCEAQNGIHAGGMVWYGDHLYVADTANGMRVFDLRTIMDLNPDNDAAVNDPTPDGLVSDVTDKKRIGRQNNVWYGYGYRYVMPQVATLTFTTAKNGGATSNNQCYATGRPKASYISLDRTGDDHLLLGEYCNYNNGGSSHGRVGTYPMTALTAAVEGAAGTTARADLAYGLPDTGTFGGEDLWHKIQGVMRYEGKWYFHRSNAYATGRLLQATPRTVGGTTELVANPKILQSSYGPEDLYLAHGRGDGFTPKLWSLSEHAPRECGVCKRELYSYEMSEVIGDFGS